MEIVAEWPGLISEINVQIGDVVEVDQELVLIESMKMLMPVVATAAGSVTSIAVSVGDSVDTGALLLEIAV